MRPALAALAAAALVLACGPDEEPRSATERSAPAPEPAAPPLPAIELPPRGEARAVRSGDRYTLVSNGAPPADALDALASEARFVVEGEVPGGEGTRIEIRDVSAVAALRAIGLPTPFVAHFEPDRTGRAALARVTLGASAPLATEPAAADAPPEPDDAASVDELALPGEAERRAAVERDWRDARDSVRLEALELMEPDLDREKIETLLRSDPSDDVRASAAELLAEGDAFEVTGPLLAALADREPAVVLAAIRSLEDVYDAVPNPQIRERVGALREHPDPDVRTAIADFEEWIAP